MDKGPSRLRAIVWGIAFTAVLGSLTPNGTDDVTLVGIART